MIQVNDVIEIFDKLADIRKKFYWENVIFSWQWWFLIIIMVVLWTTWVILVDKKRLHTILMVGIISSLFAGVLDDMGLSFALWYYQYPLTPLTSRLDPVNMAIIPVFYMFLYQYARRWGPYLIALTLLTLFAVLVAEPIFEKSGIYIMLKWKFWYSAPIYFAMAVFVKWAVDRLERNLLKHLADSRM